MRTPVEAGSGADTSRYIFSQVEWARRVGQSTLEAIEALLETTSTELAPARHQLRVAKDNLSRAINGVDVRDPLTVAGVAGLVTLGLKTDADAAAMLLPRE